MTIRNFLLTIIPLTMAISVLAQNKPVKYDLYDLGKSGKLQVFNRQLTPFADKEQKGVRVSENEGDGVVWLEGVDFSNGIIEVDIRGKDVLQHSFVGVAFHGKDEKILDAVYFRPFNFQSSDSVRRIHAVQYVSHPDFPWNKLREERNGQFEKAVSPAPDPNEWFHAKLIIDYPLVRVFVNNNVKPSLEVQQLNETKNGKIGLWVGNTSGGDFANFSITVK